MRARVGSIQVRASAVALSAGTDVTKAFELCHLLDHIKPGEQDTSETRERDRKRT